MTTFQLACILHESLLEGPKEAVESTCTIATSTREKRAEVAAHFAIRRRFEHTMAAFAAGVGVSLKKVTICQLSSIALSTLSLLNGLLVGNTEQTSTSTDLDKFAKPALKLGHSFPRLKAQGLTQGVL